MWNHANNTASTDFSLEKMQEAMKKGEQIKAEHEMQQAGCNLDMLSQKCKICGYTPKLEGGIATGRILVCNHILTWMKETLPKHPVQNYDVFGSFGGLEIIVDKEK